MIKQLTRAALLLFGIASCQAQSKDWTECAQSIKDQLNAGDHKGAVISIERCRRSFKPVPGPAYLVFLNNAGIAYAEFGQLDRAIEVKKEALTLTQNSFPSTHFEVVDSQLGLAIAYLYAEKPTQALPLLDEAYAASSHMHFSKPQLALRVKRTLATVYDILGDLDRAIPLATQALKSAEQQKLDPLELSFFQTELALMLRQTSDSAAALPLLWAAYRVRKADAPLGNYGVANAAFNLALSYIDACSTTEARKLLEESYEWRLENLGSLHPASIRTRKIIEVLNENSCKR